VYITVGGIGGGSEFWPGQMHFAVPTRIIAHWML